MPTTLSPIALALLGRLGQLPPDDTEQDGDVDTLAPPEKSFFDPGEPTNQARGLFDRLMGAMPDLRRTPKPGQSMKSAAPDNGKPTRAVLNEALVGGRPTILPSMPEPDLSGDVSRQLAVADAQRQARLAESAARQQTQQDQDHAAGFAAQIQDTEDRFPDYRVAERPDFSGAQHLSPLMSESLRASVPLASSSGSKQWRPDGIEQLPRFAGTNAPVSKSFVGPSQSGVYQDDRPRRLKDNEIFNAAQDNVKSVLPGGHSLRDRLQAVEAKFADDFVGPQQTPKQKQASRKQAQYDAELELGDKEVDRKLAAAWKSREPSQNNAQRSLVDAILGRKQPSGKTRSDELYDDTMSEFRNRQTLANRNAGMGNSAALYAGTPRYNAKLPGGSKPAVDQEALNQAEFEANKARMAASHGDPTTDGGKMTARNLRQMSDEDKLARDTSPAGRAYLAKISQQAGLSKPVASLDEFRQQQALNRQQNTELAKERSQKNLASLMIGRGGGSLPKDSDLAATRAFNAGRRRSPTMADMLQYQKDETGQKLAEATRGVKLDQIAKLNQVLMNPLIDAKTKESTQQQMNVLLKQLENSGVSTDQGVPSIHTDSKYTPDELAALVPKNGAAAKLKPKGSVTTTPKKDDQPPGLFGSLFKAMTRAPYAGMTKEEKDAAIKKAQDESPYRGRFGGY